MFDDEPADIDDRNPDMAFYGQDIEHLIETPEWFGCGNCGQSFTDSFAYDEYIRCPSCGSSRIKRII